MAFYCINCGWQLQWKAGRRAPLLMRLQSLFSDPFQQRARKWIPGQYKIRKLSQVIRRSMKYAPAAMLPLVAEGMCLDSKLVNLAKNQIDTLRSGVGEAAMMEKDQVMDLGPKSYTRYSLSNGGSKSSISRAKGLEVEQYSMFQVGMRPSVTKATLSSSETVLSCYFRTSPLT